MHLSVTNTQRVPNHSSIVPVKSAPTECGLYLLAPIPRLRFVERLFVIESRQRVLDCLNKDKCLVRIYSVDR